MALYHETVVDRMMIKSGGCVCCRMMARICFTVMAFYHETVVDTMVVLMMAVFVAG